MSILNDASRAARSGHLVVMPTDTVYGIGASAAHPDTGDRLFSAKGRPRELELPVLVSSAQEAERIAGFDERARRLADAFWPGALTLVLPRSEESASWNLGANRETIGVRVPNHALALELLRLVGPMAVTSANPSGRPPLQTCDQLAEAFGDQVDIYLCEEGPLVGMSSTVVDLTGEDLLILREGSITRSDLDAALA